jgi:hypothetical protein
MTDKKLSHKLYSLYVMASVLLVLCCGISLSAEVYQPVQIILPGNIQGKSVKPGTGLEIYPDLCWRLPETIAGLRRNRNIATIVLATGNDSSIFMPLSFLSKGALERELIAQTTPDAAALSHNDLEMYSTGLLDSSIKTRIWTNTDGEFSLFRSHALKRSGKRNIWFFNFIGHEQCRQLPLENWGQFSIDDPGRAIRRHAFPVQKDDYTISIVYLDAAGIASLASELKYLPGYHFIIQIPSTGEKPLFSTIYGEQEQNLFKMSLQPGHSFLPVLNIFSRNFSAAPRMTLRMLPLTKTSGNSGNNLFWTSINRFKEDFVKTVRLIKTTHQASTSAFRLKRSLHAHLLRSHSGCDIAIVMPPEQALFTDNVIATGHILTGFANQRTRRFRLNGQALLSLLEKAMALDSMNQLVYSGCDIKYSGGRITSLQINGQEYDSANNYSIATTEVTCNASGFASLFENAEFEPVNGQTLWQVWQNGLKSLRIADELLTEK